MDAHLRKFQRDLSRVVIAENSKDTIFGTDSAEDQSHPRIDFGASAKDFEAVVTGHYANVDGQSTHDLSGSLCQTVDSIDVEI
jgi:hypothetical protein